MASSVCAYVASLFGNAELADCVVVFCQARSEEGDANEGQASEEDEDGEESDEEGEALRQRKEDGDEAARAQAFFALFEEGERSQSAAGVAFAVGRRPGSSVPPSGSLLGDPLPAHRMALFGGSARLRAQAERWTAEQQAYGSKPELRVPLGSPEDLPHALSALRFMYAGKVDCSSAAQLLQVRRQAAYLLVEGCVEACDAALLARVSEQAPQQQAGLAPSSSSSSNLLLAPVAELFACRHLLPEPAESGGDTTIAGLMGACRDQLVLHSGGAAGDIGAAGEGAGGGSSSNESSASLGELLAWAFQDAPSLLCDPDMRRQMEALPASAMEALLGSDSFATDDEATVLLVLAHWQTANLVPFALACDKLCRLVRLSQLSEEYRLFTLPHIPWFSLSREEHAFLCQFLLATSAQPKKRGALAAAAVGKYDTTSPWYTAGARPHGRSDLNRPYCWHIKQEDLVPVQEASSSVSLTGSFDNGTGRLVSCGFEWHVSVSIKGGCEAAGVFLDCRMPAALGLLHPVKCVRLGSISARLVVHQWCGMGDGGREVAYLKQYQANEDFVKVGSGWGRMSALPLGWMQQQASAQLGGGEVDVAHRWAAYLHEGRVTGFLEFV